MPGSSCTPRSEDMKWLVAAALTGAAALELAVRTETERADIVEPVVRKDVESLLAPITLDGNENANDEGKTLRTNR